MKTNRAANTSYRESISKKASELRGTLVWLRLAVAMIFTVAHPERLWAV